MSSGRQSKRRRVEKQCSSSASASSQRSIKSHPKTDSSEKERLLYVLENISNKKIVSTLKEAVKKSGEKLPSLATVFDKRKFPSKVEVMSKCGRCGEHFDPNYNNNKSCEVPHPDCDWIRKTYPYGYEWQCTSCEKTWTTDGLDDVIESDPEIHYCYVGRHSVDGDSESDADSD